MFIPLSKMVGCLSSFLPICLIFLLPPQMPVGGTEQFIVLGPTEPIVALLGTDITLPCRLAPMMSADDMEVRWYRSQISEAVLVFQKGTEQPGEQLMEYMGRTELLSDFISEGRLAVKVYNVQMSDNGEYRCFFKKGNIHQEAILEVKVASLGSAPQLHLAGYENGGIQFVCTTDGWFPEPQVQCRDNKRGKLLPSETQAQDRDGFFHVEASIVVRDSSVRSVSCSIHNTLLGQEKMSVIDIPEAFFPRTSPWKNALIVILTMFGILFGISMLFLWKEKKKLRRLCQKKKEEQEVKENLIKELGWKKANIYPDWRKKYFMTLTVTLDTDSADHNIIVSKENGTVLINIKNDTEENCSVLGQKLNISERYYWEVEVETGSKDNWCLGICKENVKRQGFVNDVPDKGFWAVGCLQGKFQAKLDRKPGDDCLPLGEIPKRVGIFLDCESGDISFYNLTNGSYLYSFHTGPFFVPVLPYFNIQSKTTSFKICNVPDRTESIHAPSVETQAVSQEQGQLHDLSDKNWNSDDKSAKIQNYSPSHYKHASQNTQDPELSKSLLL
ncbi:butyrophilin subfamily 1 member A1-like [Macrotis lagotis]|uniref:butyrophilin subfamily 1 member A1-like n=1 Tax=Macrotis lagotis TaxID=92651 RepID=UPI003D694F09